MPFYRLRVVVLPLSWLVLTLEGRNRKNDEAVDLVDIRISTHIRNM